MTYSSYWLTNVRLETGYQYNNNETITGTDTAIFHLLVENGKFTKIVPQETVISDNVIKYDAQKWLLLPTFKEMHIHLDKTYYGGPWKAVTPAKSIFDRFAEEKELLPQLLPTAKDRAEKILNLLIGFGSTHVRTHVNIDPVVGLKNLEATLDALQTFSGKISHEIVAFPQHGLLQSGVESLVREALKHGATHVGGVDPHTVDGNIEKSLNTIIEMAVDTNSEIDIHIHDRDHLGLFTMNRLADLTEQARLHNKVTVSHAFGFAGIPDTKAAELAARFAQLGIEVTSTVPIGKLIMPIPLLKEKGVQVSLGTDSLTDHWSPFGNGDNLEKAGRLAELYGYADEWSLSQSLKFITGGKTPLDKQGKQVWPVVGDDADMNLVKASCSAEAVARRATREAVFYKGTLLSGSLSH
ncbi:amidohydrolase family protein [Niallia taxi]|uniref:amidohydrolase family protein n=1 Tax=Niallia taxi TaxID=2499688 RepID=UPI0020421149|nr:amidohydrolase family protein [Niallia taxi]MCM3217885.1 amidohydrolase family protein [Niallia taxi]MED4039388.1 amidohydrolase family protein [Niallia taxi]